MVHSGSSSAVRGDVRNRASFGFLTITTASASDDDDDDGNDEDFFFFFLSTTNFDLTVPSAASCSLAWRSSFIIVRSSGNNHLAVFSLIVVVSFPSSLSSSSTPSFGDVVSALSHNNRS